MSTIKTIKSQLGQSVTATNNFTITAEAADGTMKLARGNAGATTQDILTVDAAGKVSITQGQLPTSGSGVMVKTTSSAPYIPAGGELLSRPHGLGFVPTSAKLVLECVVADAGYSVGDKVIPAGYWNGSAAGSIGCFVDGTNCGTKCATGFWIYIYNKSTGATATPTANAWKYFYEVTA